MRVWISWSPVATRRLRLSALTASIVSRWWCGVMPAGDERLTIGSPLERKGTPWWIVGRKPDPQFTAPPRGPRGPDWSTTNPGRSFDSDPIPYVTHDPMLGRPFIDEPVFMNSLAGAWLKTSVATDFTSVMSSTICAVCGYRSETQVPFFPWRRERRDGSCSLKARYFVGHRQP